jgi:glycosyltransferase involved in cell wall biosynthesis
MKVAIASVQVPFITGGAELHAMMLCNELKKRGHQADIITIPFKWYPTTTLLNCMVVGRMMDLSEVNGEKIDRVIALKFPAYFCKHDNKVLWLLHQHRQAYDLWGTEYGDIHKLPDGEYIKRMIVEHDNKYISEAKAVYTNSQNTADRLLKYNGIKGEPLYHPPFNHELMKCEKYSGYIFYSSRIGLIKRQRLLVEAARFVHTDIKILIAGSGSDEELRYINQYIKKYSLKDRVKLLGFISEEEKLMHYANCLAVYFGAFDEDYGYITLEAFFSRKPVIVHHDAGGPLEFVENGKNGYIIEPSAKALAEKIDFLYENRGIAEKMGNAGFQTLQEKHLDWDYVIDKLLN